MGPQKSGTCLSPSLQLKTTFGTKVIVWSFAALVSRKIIIKINERRSFGTAEKLSLIGSGF